MPGSPLTTTSEAGTSPLGDAPIGRTQAAAEDVVDRLLLLVRQTKPVTDKHRPQLDERGARRRASRSSIPR